MNNLPSEKANGYLTVAACQDWCLAHFWKRPSPYIAIFILYVILLIRSLLKEIR